MMNQIVVQLGESDFAMQRAFELGNRVFTEAC